MLSWYVVVMLNGGWNTYSEPYCSVMYCWSTMVARSGRIARMSMARSKVVGVAASAGMSLLSGVGSLYHSPHATAFSSIATSIPLKQPLPSSP